MANKWSCEEIKIMELYFPIYSNDEMLSLLLNRSKFSIKFKATQMRLQKEKHISKQKLDELFNQGLYYCKTCKCIYLLENFYTNDDMKYGVINECKICKSKRNTDYDKSHRDKKRQYQKMYRIKNYNHIYLRNSEYGKKYRKLDDVKNRLRIYKQSRRSIKNSLIADLTQNQWFDTLKEFTDYNGNIRCCYCNEIIKNPQQEHIIALINGGGYTKSNIIPSCAKCNSSKGKKTLEEFFIYNEDFSINAYNKIIEFIHTHSKKESV